MWLKALSGNTYIKKFGAGIQVVVFPFDEHGKPIFEVKHETQEAPVIDLMLMLMGPNI